MSGDTVTVLIMLGAIMFVLVVGNLAISIIQGIGKKNNIDSTDVATNTMSGKPKKGEESIFDKYAIDEAGHMPAVDIGKPIDIDGVK